MKLVILETHILRMVTNNTTLKFVKYGGFFYVKNKIAGIYFYHFYGNCHGLCHDLLQHCA